MSKYLTRFETLDEFDEYFESLDFLSPNVSLVDAIPLVIFNEYDPMGSYYKKPQIDSLVQILRNHQSQNKQEETTKIGVLSGIVDTELNKTIPTKLSQVENNVGYINEAYLSRFITGVTETDPTVKSWAKALTKPSYNASDVGALPSTATLDDIGDGSSRKLSNLVLKDGTKVLVTNDYTNAEKTKLAGIASNAQVNVIDSVKVNGTALQVTNKAVNISIPKDMGDLTNNSNFVTTAATKDFTTTAKTKTQIERYNYTTAVGTITDIRMNNQSKGASGVVNLGTVVTSFKINSTNASISNGAASITIDLPEGLPSVTASDNGKMMVVANGQWVKGMV